MIDFSALQKLDNLEVHGNLLTGSIPLSLTKCQGLKRVDLSSNLLTGTIPSEFGSIPTLQILHFKVSSDSLGHYI
jgi:Leucine-rich repeat (LRR) protein